MSIDARYRDKNSEINRKHGSALIHTLRMTYGFAPRPTTVPGSGMWAYGLLSKRNSVIDITECMTGLLDYACR